MGYLDNTGLAYLWQKVKTLLNAKAPTSHASTATTYGKGTASNYGHVRLSDSTSSTSAASAGIAATPKAVKAAYDLANTASTAAAAAQSTAETASTAAAAAQSTAETASTAAAAAQSTANAAMPKSGGTFTGVVNGSLVTASSWSFKNISVHTSAGGNTGTNVQRIVMMRK